MGEYCIQDNPKNLQKWVLSASYTKQAALQRHDNDWQNCNSRNVSCVINQIFMYLSGKSQDHQLRICQDQLSGILYLSQIQQISKSQPGIYQDDNYGKYRITIVALNVETHIVTSQQDKMSSDISDNVC